jgi:hypothetical protein
LKRVLVALSFGVILTVVLIAVLSSDQNSTESPGNDVLPATLQELPTYPVVVALDDLPRGFELTEDRVWGPNRVVAVVYWPESTLPGPGNYFEDVNGLVGRVIRTDIPRGLPITARQVVDDVEHLGEIGSDLALSLDTQSSEYAVPVRLSSIQDMPDDLALYDTVAVWGIFDLDTVETIQIVEQASVIEFNGDSEIVTLAVQGNLQLMTLIWAEDAGTPLRIIRLPPQFEASRN